MVLTGLSRQTTQALVVAVALSYVIGRGCHALGLHHTGGHAVAETLVLFVVALGVLVGASPRRSHS